MPFKNSTRETLFQKKKKNSIALFNKFKEDLENSAIFFHNWLKMVIFQNCKNNQPLVNLFCSWKKTVNFQNKINLIPRQWALNRKNIFSRKKNFKFQLFLSFFNFFKIFFKTQAHLRTLKKNLIKSNKKRYFFSFCKLTWQKKGRKVAKNVFFQKPKNIVQNQRFHLQFQSVHCVHCRKK